MASFLGLFALLLGVSAVTVAVAFGVLYRLGMLRRYGLAPTDGKPTAWTVVQVVSGDGWARAVAPALVCAPLVVVVTGHVEVRAQNEAGTSIRRVEVQRTEERGTRVASFSRVA